MFKEDEEIENEKCRTAKKDMAYNSQISKLLQLHLKNKNSNVYLSGDLHLWKTSEIDDHTLVKRYDFDTIVNRLQKTITDKDLWVVLGDLVDGEFRTPSELRKVMLSIPGKKILVLGNNDLLGYEFYRSCGFLYVTRAFVWNDVLFSHYPLENDYSMNIHAHIHGFKRYWIPYTNQVDVFSKDRAPRLLFDVINAQPEYAKHIIEVKKDAVTQEGASLFRTQISQWDYFENRRDPFKD